MGKFVEVKVFSTRLEVELAQGLLEGNDIESRTMPDENEPASTRGGIRLLVPEEHAEEAKELLTEFDLDMADMDDDDDEEYVRSGDGDDVFDETDDEAQD